MQQSYRIRRAGGADAAAIARHRRLMFEEMGLAAGAALDRLERDTARALIPALAVDHYAHWFAEVDGAIAAGAGVIVVDWLPMPGEPALRRATIVNVYTEHPHRLRGLARRLTIEASDWCRTLGLACVQLHASEAGRPLYSSLGFRATNEMRLALT